MKKVLIGTTALVAASMLSLPAMAMHIDEDGNYEAHTGNLSLIIGGYGTFKFEYKSREEDEDDTVSYRNHNADFDSELHFEGSTLLANGTEAGIEIQFETGGSSVAGTDTIDENFIWVEGVFGKVYLGGRDAEELEEGVERTYSGVGLLNRDMSETNEASISTSADAAGDENNKVIWVAPTVGGIEFAVNYTPELTQNTTSASTNKDVGEEGEDLLVALRWTGAMGAATVKVSLGYGTTKAEDSSADKDVENDKRQRLGFEVAGIAGITIGGFWLKHADDSEDVTPTEDETSMGIGGTWESGKWEFGIGWETSKHDELTEAAVNVKDGTDKHTRIDIGMEYDVNDDMKIIIGYRQEKYQDDQNLATAENNTKSLDAKFEWNVGPGLEVDFGLQNYRYTHVLGLAAPAKKTGTAGYILTKVSF